MRVLVCGGGTGGHIYPALAMVTELRAEGLSTEDVLWIGTRGEMEETIVPRAGIRLETIGGGPIVGVALHKRARNSARLFWSLGKATRLMRAFRPDVLFLTGGYVNVPVTLAARVFRTPSAIFLPDIEPGAAIRWLSHFVQRIACSVDASKKYLDPQKVVVTGYPVRAELRQALALRREEALEAFDLAAKRRTLFVFGGSRGARSINMALIGGLRALLAQYQVIHVSGQLDWPAVSEVAARLPDHLREHYRPFAYLHERMGAAFRAADLVVARAGASMLGESPAFGLPSVLVPYPHAWRYQKVNADYLVERGAAVRLDDEYLAQQFVPVVTDLLEDEERLMAMAAAARALDRPHAANRLAQLTRELAKGDRVKIDG